MWGKVTAAGQSAPQCPQAPGMLLFPSPPSAGFPADGLGSWQGCCAQVRCSGRRESPGAGRPVSLGRGQEALTRASTRGSLHACHLGPVAWLGSVEPCLLGLWLKLVWCGVVVARLHDWRKLPSGPGCSIGLGPGASLLEAQDRVCAWAASLFGELLRYPSGPLTTAGCCSTCLRTAGGPAGGGTGHGLSLMLRAARALEDEEYSRRTCLGTPVSLPPWKGQALWHRSHWGQKSQVVGSGA